jgi:anti-sigma factor RsiW
MTGSEHDKQLWRRFADAQGSAPAPLPPGRGRAGEGDRTNDATASLSAPSLLAGEGDLLLLAAWIDGRLEGAEREAVEARLAGDPALLDLAFSAARSKGLAAPWPKRAEARAAALLAPARPGWRFMAAAAAAVVIVALGGFEMGQAGSELLSADSETDLAAELGLLPETDLVETLL